MTGVNKQATLTMDGKVFTILVDRIEMDSKVFDSITFNDLTSAISKETTITIKGKVQLVSRVAP